MKKLPYLITTFIIFGLVACNGQTPTVVPSPVVQTRKPYPTLTVMSTPTLSGGRKDTMLATTSARATQTNHDCDGHPKSRKYFSDTKSPNGAWRTNSCIDPKNGYSYIQIIQVNGNATWHVSFYEAFISKLKSDTIPEGFKDGEIQIVHWSADEKYVYLSPYICCIDGPVLLNGFPRLYQLDLNTGKLQDILPSGGRIGFSPDDKYLAYRTLPATVHLRNLQTGDDKSFLLNSKYVNLGVFSWSPDSSKFVFVAALEDWDQNIYEPTPVSTDGFSLILLDLKTMKVTTLIDNDIRMLIPSSYSDENVWIDNNQFYLNKAYQPDGDDGTAYLYDLLKQQLTLISRPTRTPSP